MHDSTIKPMTLVINWVNYHFMNKYSIGKTIEELKDEIITCTLSIELIKFLKEKNENKNIL